MSSDPEEDRSQFSGLGVDDDQSWGWFGVVTGFIARILIKLRIFKVQDPPE